jgi:hypothetical protein
MLQKTCCLYIAVNAVVTEFALKLVCVQGVTIFFLAATHNPIPSFCLRT